MSRKLTWNRSQAQAALNRSARRRSEAVTDPSTPPLPFAMSHAPTETEQQAQGAMFTISRWVRISGDLRTLFHAGTNDFARAAVLASMSPDRCVVYRGDRLVFDNHRPIRDE